MELDKWRTYDLNYQVEQIRKKDSDPEEQPKDENALPQPFPLNTVFRNPPPLAPVLIDGVLRQGHKMLLSGPSKAGKSFALIRLAIAFAEGFNWFGSRCQKGKVLYINMEIDDASCINRFMKIYNGDLKLDSDAHPENITIWGLRGYSQPLKQLTDKIIATAQRNYIAIIIDPLYKVMDGDENSNSDISRMVGEFDKIARETGAAVIYAHHFAKGSSGDKAVIDRAAGAGTFARDPDAIVTMTQLDAQPRHNNEKGIEETAWRVEYILREFPNKEPYNVWFSYPVHRYDETLADCEVETQATKKEHQKQKLTEKKKEARRADVVNVVKDISETDGSFYFKDFERAYGMIEPDITDKTMQRRLRDAGYDADKQEKVGEPVRWRRKK